MLKSVELVYLPLTGAPVHGIFPYQRGMTVADVLQHAALATTHPETTTLEVGIFSKQVTHDHVLQPGDRVELYRPLLSCPKEKRRKRVTPRAR